MSIRRFPNSGISCVSSSRTPVCVEGGTASVIGSLIIDPPPLPPPEKTLTVEGDADITGVIDPTGVLYTASAARPITPSSTQGLVWVESTTPSLLKFTDSAGTDFTIFGDVSELGDLTNVTDNGTTGIIMIVGDGSPAGNLFLGQSAGSNALPSRSNVGLGAFTLENLTTGIGNIAIGRQSLSATETGGGNIGIGERSLPNVGSGLNNIGIGRDSGNNIITGNGNVIIGESADTTTSDLIDTIAIGTSATVSGDFDVRLGQNTNGGGGVMSYRSQVVSKETWANTLTTGAFISGDGDIIKYLDNVSIIVDRRGGTANDWSRSFGQPPIPSFFWELGYVHVAAFGIPVSLNPTEFQTFTYTFPRSYKNNPMIFTTAGLAFVFAFPVRSSITPNESDIVIWNQGGTGAAVPVNEPVYILVIGPPDGIID